MYTFEAQSSQMLRKCLQHIIPGSLGGGGSVPLAGGPKLKSASRPACDGTLTRRLPKGHCWLCCKLLQPCCCCQACCCCSCCVKASWQLLGVQPLHPARTRVPWAG
jgi:hypothetical protein